MRLRALEARLARLEAQRGTGRYDHLSYEEVEQLLFDRLHRLVTAAGGIDELMAEWDAATDPEERALIVEIRAHDRDVREHYIEMEARLCPRH
ncbi:hypothetical protein [Methylobacterium sp. CM6257]